MGFLVVSMPFLTSAAIFISSLPSLLSPDLPGQVGRIEAHISRPQRSGEDLLGLPINLPAELRLESLHHVFLVDQRKVLDVSDEDVPVVGQFAEVLHRYIAVVSQLDTSTNAVI